MSFGDDAFNFFDHLFFKSDKNLQDLMAIQRYKPNVATI